ncbi:MAG: hypothetical protein E7166_00895 [Firmicutes bacterium]|nr:hypothetical protein [Bacillota bacterium]
MLNEMKTDLEKEFSEIGDYCNECENKQKVLQANTTASKFTKTGTIGVVSLLPTIVAGVSIIAPISSAFTLPLTASLGVAFASSVAIGYAGQAIITARAKKKMKEFTDAKTNADILEEMMHYEMEIDKSENKQEALRKMYKSIESRQQILSDYSSEFYQIDKYADLTTETLKERQEMLTRAYNERMEQLDVLTSQAYLKNKVKLNRKKRHRIENIISYALMMSFPFCLLIGMPLSIELMRNTTLETMAEFGKLMALCFSPTLVVAPLSIPFFAKNNNDFMNAFNNLNKSLGENALSEKPNVEYEDELKYMISTKIGEIVELGMELKEVGYAIEKRSVETATESKDKSKEKTDSILDNLGRKSVENIINDTTPFPDAVYRPNYYTHTTMEEEVQEKGPSLVKKRIPPKNNK